MSSSSAFASPSGGGRFDFDDGGTYCGGWEDGKAHGHGVCTGPKGQGEYCGSWAGGFEVSGVYTWPSGFTYEGEWANGKRHGLGSETRGRWVYRGEWTEGFKGRYGVRQSISSVAKYDGTWQSGLPDGYGSETYADGGTFQGQWAKGMRHGYGVRSSAPFGLAAHTRRQSERKSPPPEGSHSSTLERREEGRGGFVLRGTSVRNTWSKSVTEHNTKGFKGLLMKTKRTSYEEEVDEGELSDEGSEGSFVVQEDEKVDGNVIETYMGEWKNDRRNGFGIAERSDGIKYEGEWYNNKKFGYGRTTYRNGLEENGKYKNNILLSTGRAKHILFLRSAKFRERVAAAVNGAHRSSQIALQKADIAISRTATARGKAEQADSAARQSRGDSDMARMIAKNYAPEFQQPGSNFVKRKFASSQDSTDYPSGDHTNANRRSFPSEADYYNRQPPPPPEFHLSPPTEPSQPSAFLGLFSNNPDRRPSNAGFLRRPSSVGLNRRPSTVVEHSIAPSQFEVPFQNYNYAQRYHHPPPQHHHQQQQVTLQQVIDDHNVHYYESSKPPSPIGPVVKKPAIDLTELSILYGIPLSRPMDDEEEAPFIPQRRSTMPTVIDGPNFLQVNPSTATDGMVRTGSMYTKKAEAAIGATVAPARKKSLPDINNISEPRVLTREAIAFLSSQRREAIRKQEEEAERLRANPLLYLFSPEVWDWLASQQLVILVLVINIALGFMFFKIIM